MARYEYDHNKEKFLDAIGVDVEYFRELKGKLSQEVSETGEISLPKEDLLTLILNADPNSTILEAFLTYVLIDFDKETPQSFSEMHELLSTLDIDMNLLNITALGILYADMYEASPVPRYTVGLIYAHYDHTFIFEDWYQKVLKYELVSATNSVEFYSLMQALADLNFNDLRKKYEVLSNVYSIAGFISQLENSIQKFIESFLVITTAKKTLKNTEG